MANLDELDRTATDEPLMIFGDTLVTMDELRDLHSIDVFHRNAELLCMVRVNLLTNRRYFGVNIHASHEAADQEDFGDAVRNVVKKLNDTETFGWRWLVRVHEKSDDLPEDGVRIVFLRRDRGLDGKPAPSLKTRKLFGAAFARAIAKIERDPTTVVCVMTETEETGRVEERIISDTCSSTHVENMKIQLMAHVVDSVAGYRTFEMICTSSPSDFLAEKEPCPVA